MDVDLSESAGNKPISVISIPDSQAEEELVSLVGEKRKRAIEEEEDPARGDGNSKSKSSSVQKKSKKAKTTGSDKETKKKAPAKKAKGRTVISDDEEEVAGDDMVLDLDDPPTVVDLEGSPECPPAQPDSDAENEDPHEKMKPAKKRQSKKSVVSDSEGEEDEALQDGPEETSQPLTCSKNHVENTNQNPKPASSPKKNVDGIPKPVVPSISSRYTIASRTKSTPMAELIRKVNSRPGSPFPASASRLRAPSLGGAASPSTPSASYSPFNKFSRSALSRIAPLHPNRRTPPPPLPPPPPKPKTKKEKEREERWEEEMIEAVGGWDAWKLLTEEEQKAAKRAKWAHELEGWED
ncbi:hypothetical protein B0H11DRAFT_2067544 [Mycena galericulata]|nr:hypothetical protein B0H11DRAFT_2067544 [Mycena galericulata]